MWEDDYNPPYQNMFPKSWIVKEVNVERFSTTWNRYTDIWNTHNADKTYYLFIEKDSGAGCLMGGSANQYKLNQVITWEDGYVPPQLFP